MLFNAGLWAPAVARVLDTSLRYTVDKTTREILFLPLPTAIKYRAKPFVDVTMDRFAKALGALLVLVLIKPWGFALTWQQLSYASLALMALVDRDGASAGKREYLATFRRSIARHDVEAGGDPRCSTPTCRPSNCSSRSWRIPTSGACCTRSICSSRSRSGT